MCLLTYYTTKNSIINITGIGNTRKYLFIFYFEKNLLKNNNIKLKQVLFGITKQQFATQFSNLTNHEGKLRIRVTCHTVSLCLLCTQFQD